MIEGNDIFKLTFNVEITFIIWFAMVSLIMPFQLVQSTSAYDGSLSLPLTSEHKLNKPACLQNSLFSLQLEVCVLFPYLLYHSKNKVVLLSFNPIKPTGGGGAESAPLAVFCL